MKRSDIEKAAIKFSFEPWPENIDSRDKHALAKVWGHFAIQIVNAALSEAITHLDKHECDKAGFCGCAVNIGLDIRALKIENE